MQVGCPERLSFGLASHRTALPPLKPPRTFPARSSHGAPLQRTGVANTRSRIAAISLAENPGTASAAQGMVNPCTMQ